VSQLQLLPNLPPCLHIVCRRKLLNFDGWLEADEKQSKDYQSGRYADHATTYEVFHVSSAGA
jgi:hypothetical protein